MENVAHALAGLLLARGVVVLRSRREGPAPSSRFATRAAWVSALANNVADGDLVLTPLTGGKLGYLLHHRGHTHTAPVGLALGALIALAALALWRRGAEPPSRADARWVLALGAAGPLVHLAMDGWNTYGIHPLWPVFDGWVYGDAVFIVEPLLWLAAAPLLFREASSRAARWILGAVAALGVALPWALPGFVPLPARLALVAFGLAAVAVARLSIPARRTLGAIGLFFAVPAAFLAAGVAARAEARARSAADFPGETVWDVASTAWPSNPLCWSMITVGEDGRGALVARRFTLALAPSWLPLERCPRREGPTTAPLEVVDAAPTRHVRWEGEHRADLARLSALARERCDVAAALRFIRVPFLVEERDRLVLGDLRFDRDARLDFAELELPARPLACPAFVPPWAPPRGRELGLGEGP